MVEVTIYTKTGCPYCARAKELFDELKVEYEEKKVDDEDKKNRLVQRTGHFTVPQIFIGKEFIGGSDDLYDLYDSGELKKLLTGESNES